MKTQFITDQLHKNRNVFQGLLENVPKEVYLWRPSPKKWCLLEIVCHLFDEEREDFKARVKHTLETPDEKMAPIDPVGWVKKRNYIGEDFDQKLTDFLIERDISVEWLRSLSTPKWENISNHPKLGPITAGTFLASWLAHDYLHFRQITKLKYDYLESIGGDVGYAGGW